MEWFYAKEGKQLGPVSSDELRRLASEKSLGPTDLVWKEGMANWRPASEIEGIFSAPPATVSSTDAPAVGFWARAGASVIDGIALGVGSRIFTAVLPASAAGFYSSFLLSLVIGGSYYTWMTANFGQTLGKMAVGIKVIRLDGSPVPIGTAALRWLGYWLDNLTLGIGYLLAAFTDQKRGLHDYVAGTRVVYLPQNRAALGVVIGVLGFGLIPLAGILAAIAIPNFAKLTEKSKEGADKGNLGVLRSSLSIYYGDNNGSYPADLQTLVQDHKYLASIPMVKTKNHGETNRVEVYGNEVCNPNAGHGSSAIDGTRLRDTGAWGYVGDKNSPCFGSVFIDCTHTDTRSQTWFSY